jgi:hypothetical protein
MPLWRFMDYISDEGTNLIQEWYKAQDDEGIRADFDATLFILGGTEDWTHKRVKAFKVLTGKHVGLCELRFTVEIERKKRRFRPLGIWRKDSRDFVLLGGCEKSGRILIPSNAFDLALHYKAEFEGGKGRINEHT